MASPSGNRPSLPAPTFLEYTLREVPGSDEVVLENATSVGGMPLHFAPEKHVGVISKHDPTKIITVTMPSAKTSLPLPDGSVFRGLPKFGAMRVRDESFANPTGGVVKFSEDTPVEFEVDKRMRHVARNVTSSHGLLLLSSPRKRMEPLIAPLVYL